MIITTENIQKYKPKIFTILLCRTYDISPTNTSKEWEYYISYSKVNDIWGQVGQSKTKYNIFP